MYPHLFAELCKSTGNLKLIQTWCLRTCARVSAQCGAMLRERVPEMLLSRDRLSTGARYSHGNKSSGLWVKGPRN